MAEFVCNFRFVGVPSDFIENIMPQANGAFVKVYLYALNAASNGTACDFARIAEDLELLESDVINALNYLSDKCALSFDGNTVAFGATGVEDKPKKKPKLTEPEQTPKRYNKNIKQIVTENSILSDLCMLAQQMLEKTLSDRDIETLYWFYDELGLSPEVILMILEYCISNEKRSMKYIEKVAIGWHENGITTIDAAENYMQEKKEKNTYFYNLRRLFGIDNRNLSKTEEMYLKTWRDTYTMSEEMVALAYEYCIISTNKLSFPYMNTIIENWYKKNIFNVQEAEKDHEEFKGSASSSTELNVYKDETGFDYDNIEKIMQEKYDKQ